MVLVYQPIRRSSRQLTLQWKSNAPQSKAIASKRDSMQLLLREIFNYKRILSHERSQNLFSLFSFTLFPPLLSLFFFFNSPILTSNARWFPLLHRSVHSRYIFYYQYQHRLGVAPTHGILYFITLMARLDTILHSGDDVSASSIDEISLSGIVSVLHRRAPGYHKGATRIVRGKSRLNGNWGKIVHFVRLLRTSRLTGHEMKLNIIG